MDITVDSETFTLAHDAEASRYTISHDGEQIGFADYHQSGETDAGGIRDFDHTVVSPAWGGRGLAGALVDYALTDTVDAGYRIRPTCSYVERYVGKHPQWQDHLA